MYSNGSDLVDISDLLLFDGLLPFFLECLGIGHMNLNLVLMHLLDVVVVHERLPNGDQIPATRIMKLLGLFVLDIGDSFEFVALVEESHLLSLVAALELVHLVDDLVLQQIGQSRTRCSWLVGQIGNAALPSARVEAESEDVVLGLAGDGVLNQLLIGNLQSLGGLVRVVRPVGKKECFPVVRGM